MLPASARLTRREDFATAVRRGQRVGRRTVVVHLGNSGEPDALPRAGFVVGRGVGGAVVRHRVQRQLRHLMRVRLGGLPAGALLVVRALPAAAGADSAALGDDLDSALRRLGVVDGPSGAPHPSVAHPSVAHPSVAQRGGTP